MITKFGKLELSDKFTVSTPERLVGCGMMKISENLATVYSGIPAMENGGEFRFKPEKVVNLVGHCEKRME